MDYVDACYNSYMKKTLLIIGAALVVLVLAVNLLGGKISELLAQAFGADYTGTALDIYHGNYIDYEIHATGYQKLEQTYRESDLWYPNSDIYNGAHIITNEAELAKLQKQIKNQEIAPVDFDKYVLYVDTLRTAPSSKNTNRQLRVDEIASFSANDKEVIVNRKPTNKIIKPADRKSHVGYYQILKIKKNKFPFEKRTFQSYNRDIKIDESLDETLYTE